MKTKIILAVAAVIALAAIAYGAYQTRPREVNLPNGNANIPAENNNRNTNLNNTNNANRGGDVLVPEKLNEATNQNTNDYSYETVYFKYPSGWTVLESKSGDRVLGVQVIKAENKDTYLKNVNNAAATIPYIEIREFYSGWEGTLEQFIAQMDPNWQSKYTKLTTDNEAVGYQAKFDTVVGSNEKTDPYYQTYFQNGSDLYYVNTTPLSSSNQTEVKTAYDYVIKNFGFVGK